MDVAKRSFDLSCEKDAGKIDPKTGKPSKGESVPVICERIRFYRERKGIEQKVLAAKIGITGNSVSNWENGRSRPDVNLLPAICRVLDITLYDLFNIADPTKTITASQQTLINKYEKLSDGHRYTIDKLIDTLSSIEKAEESPDLKVLMYFSRSLAAGIGDPSEFDEEAEPVYVYSTPEVSKADSIFKVNGDSMEPVFSNGQDVLVQRIRGSSDLEFGEIGAFIVGNETYIKKYERDGLYSLNPDYPVMRFEDENSVYLIGRVTGILDPSCYAKQKDIDRYRLLHNNDREMWNV